MGKLTTHVLDTTLGRPAQGVVVELRRATNGSEASVECIARGSTNADGRLDAPLLNADSLEVGRYVLSFYLGDYFRASGALLSDPPFLDVVTIPFGIASVEENYHVPLLASPWSFATYRGS
ncbi:MAG: hydroxyisourate hydrolase [Burkholderiaceae bacterium]|jgi:hydroxyisourate hydrolase